MTRRPLASPAPFAAPLASSHEHHAPLRNGRLVRITPGALSLPLWLLFFGAGGRK